jgi:hypothetical protein
VLIRAASTFESHFNEQQMNKILHTKKWAILFLLAFGFLPLGAQTIYTLGYSGYTGVLNFNDPFSWAFPPLGNPMCGGYIAWPGVPNWNSCSAVQSGDELIINSDCNIYECDYNSFNAGQTGFPIYNLNIAAGTTNIDFTNASMTFSSSPYCVVNYGAALNAINIQAIANLDNSGETSLSSYLEIYYALNNLNQLTTEPASQVSATTMDNGNIFDNGGFFINNGKLTIAEDINNYATLQNLGRIEKAGALDTLRTSGTLINDSVINKPILVTTNSILGTNPLVIFNDKDSITSLSSITSTPANLTINGTTNVKGIVKLQNFTTTFKKQPGGTVGKLNILPTGNLQVSGDFIFDIDASDVPTSTDSFLLVSGVGGNVTGTANSLTIAFGSSNGWSLVKHQDNIYAKYTVATSLNLSNIRLNGTAKNNYNELVWNNLSQESEAVLEKRVPNQSNFVKIHDAKSSESFQDYSIENVPCEYRITCIRKNGIVETSNSIIINNTRQQMVQGTAELGTLKVVSDFNTNAEIININGNVVSSIALTKGLNQIDVSQLAQGLYIVSTPQIKVKFRR